MRKEILLGGTGGQGIQLMGRILAKALNFEGYNPTSKSNYGPEARGGRSFCEVVIKEDPEDWPEVMAADIFAVMSQEAYLKPLKELKEESLIFFDPVLVNCEETEKRIPIPALTTAKKLGNERTINMVMLGAVIGFTKLVSLENTIKALDVEGKFSKINEEALREGYNLFSAGKNPLSFNFALSYFRDKFNKG